MIDKATSDFPTRRVIAKRQLQELVVRAGISSGGYLPSIRKASNLLGLNRDAIWQAYKELEREKLIEKAANGRYRRKPVGFMIGQTPGTVTTKAQASDINTV